MPDTKAPQNSPAPSADWWTVRRIGHDLNNLIGAVTGYAELVLETTAPSDPSAPDLQRIRESADRAAALVGELMAVARRNSGVRAEPVAEHARPGDAGHAGTDPARRT